MLALLLRDEMRHSREFMLEIQPASRSEVLWSRPCATLIAPIEQFMRQAAPANAAVYFRAPKTKSRMHPGNDCEAIIAFVKSKSGLSRWQIGAVERRRGINPDAAVGVRDWVHYLSHTQRAYLKETERFLLWVETQRNKTLMSIDVDDCVAYRSFLTDPQPSQLWCGARGNPRSSPAWRPFEGPLSASASRCATSILKTFYRFLIDQAYLSTNPWLGNAAAANGS